MINLTNKLTNATSTLSAHVQFVCAV